MSPESLKYTITTKGCVSSVVPTKEDTGTFGSFYNNIIGAALVGSHSDSWIRSKRFRRLSKILELKCIGPTSNSLYVYKFKRFTAYKCKLRLKLFKKRVSSRGSQ